MNYKPAIGVLQLDKSMFKGSSEDNLFTWEMPGTLGSDKTLDFPLKREVVKGATPERALAEDLELTPNYITAAKNLESQGVKAIVADCGFMCLYQQEILKAVSIPVFLSTLLAVPLVYKMLPEHRKVGIFSIDSKHLNENCFNSAGWSSRKIPIAVAGVAGMASWHNQNEKKQSDSEQMGTDLVQRAIDFTRKNTDVGAIVLECTLMPPHTPAIRKATGLPVFDIVTFTRMLFEATAG